MKLTDEMLLKLNMLKEKFYLRSWGRSGGSDTITPLLGYVKGWEIENIPPKKGFFGHSGSRHLRKIYIIEHENIGTTFVGVVNVDKSWHDQNPENLLCNKP